jgi:hypothetical protein
VLGAQQLSETLSPSRPQKAWTDQPSWRLREAVASRKHVRKAAHQNGKDDVRTSGRGGTGMQLTPLVRLVQAVWQLFQGTGEQREYDSGLDTSGAVGERRVHPGHK